MPRAQNRRSVFHSLSGGDVCYRLEIWQLTMTAKPKHPNTQDPRQRDNHTHTHIENEHQYLVLPTQTRSSTEIATPPRLEGEVRASAVRKKRTDQTNISSAKKSK